MVLKMDTARVDILYQESVGKSIYDCSADHGYGVSAKDFQHQSPRLEQFE